MRPKNQKFKDEDAFATIDMTAEEVAKQYDVGLSIVRRARKRLGLKPKHGRPRQIFLLEKVCPNCNNVFTSVSKHCSIECYQAVRTYVTSEETKTKLREKAITRWETPTDNMIIGIQKRILADEEIKSYKKYRNRLKTLTEKTYSEHRNTINPNNYKRGLAGKENAYHLDHIIPAKFGFENGIPPEILAEKENLQMLPWRDNISKGKKYDKD